MKLQTKGFTTKFDTKKEEKVVRGPVSEPGQTQDIAEIFPKYYVIFLEYYKI